MKTSILKLICGVFAVGLLFSSCLGDSDNKININNDYVFVTTKNSMKVAAVASYRTWIVTDQVNASNTIEGQYYTMGYSINTSQSLGNGVYQGTDYGQPLVRIEQTSVAVKAPDRVDDFNPTTFTSPFPYPIKDFFGDGWVFGAQAQLKEGTVTDMYFYYDASNQKEEVNGVVQEIGNNKIIIDVRFGKSLEGNGALGSRAVLYVAKMTQLRSYFQYQSGKFSFNNEKSVAIPIKFRYNKTVTENGKDVVKETLDGNWNTDSSAKYLLYFESAS